MNNPVSHRDYNQHGHPACTGYPILSSDCPQCRVAAVQDGAATIEEEYRDMTRHLPILAEATALALAVGLDAIYAALEGTGNYPPGCTSADIDRELADESWDIPPLTCPACDHEMAEACGSNECFPGCLCGCHGCHEGG